MSYFKGLGVSVRRLPRILSVIVLLTLLSSVISVVQAQPPALILSKTTDGNITTAEVGQVLHYRIRFECSSLSTACGQLTITDVLQAGLTYLPEPNSSVPAGFTIAYNAGTRTVTITKDDNNFLDGTQFDAVIAVLIDYNLRPLPQTINNTVNGTVDPPGPVGIINATPASAPPITIDTATLDWGMTKKLYRPSINPTVDTDVTYQIALCPNTNEGNVALQNVVITDNLPPGAVFVSASDGGTAAGGVVTWPTVVGPTYPPACITRFVTIRYPTPTFAVGNNVTNTANANGEYLGSNGTIIGPGTLAAPPTINHPIDPIAEVPTYSKDDVGDPVGINGTGRFVLNLNTNNTNYPSNNVVLIDNMPPNLQITEVTSGTWNLNDGVRATIEYSTNNGNTWTAFPGQPVLYNTNATYAAPVANITNVRWRFEYQNPFGGPYTPGLPYTWSFATQPEIRFVPRLVATTADAPSNAPMPVAAPGNTYTNCLQVSRTNSLGNPVTEPCDNETMTVQGNFASLRTYKNETPGTSWDDIGDPNINTFTSDTTILPNDTLRYVITVELTERSSAPLINPTIRDTIPAGLIFVRNGTAQLNGANLPVGQQPTFTQAGNNLTWEWNVGNAITVNQQVLGSQFLTVEFYGRIPRGQAPGPYTNNLQVVTDSVDAYCEVGTSPADTTDLDGDGNVAEPTCVNPDTYTVERSAALRGEKWIRSTDTQNAQVLNGTTFLPDVTCPNGGTVGLPGGGNNPFTRFPCISQAFPQGALSPGQLVPPPASTTLDDFEYNLRIFNDGNVDMTQYILYDILPYFGDTGSGGTLSTTPRLSEFQPLMRGPIQFISGPPGLIAADFTIEYNNTINPCRPEVFNQATGVNTPGGCDNNWSTAWTANARSYRIRMNAGSLLPQTAAAPELRFGVPMYIPADAPPVGTFTANDPQSLEIAWNSFSHTGSYLDLAANTRDLLASEPRKVGITIPERMSIGNRVWRDADNSGTINAPDDTNPGIANVVVNLYRDADNNGVPDGAAIATTTTDANGYYLFSNIIYDAVTPGNNIYIVGIPAINFNAGNPLFNLKSSTGPLPGQAYANPALGATDSDDNGRDPVTPGFEVLSASINLIHNTQQTGETDLSTIVPAPGVPSTRDGAFGRGVNGEQDNDSNLQIDFGFFSQVNYFSIGNRVWFDNGAGGGVLNNGIMDGGEQPIAGVTVDLYRDGNANGVPDTNEIIRTDITDAGGYYLFDQLDPGNYFVVIPASNFNPTTGALKGLFSSQPTGTELVGVAGNPTIPNTDRDDNGINVVDPSATGVRSGVIALVLNTAEATGETDLSGNPDPGVATHFNNNPTAWDGPGSIGRYGETDANSNITIDFGFIPPLSIGNRVWFDSGVGTTPFRSGFNNGLMDGTEPGVAGVTVQLWQDTDGTAGLQIATDTLLATTTTDATGYYLFDRLQPGTGYYVHIPASNFGAGQPLVNYISSYDANQTTAPADDNEDMDDNGIDSATPATTGISSSAITMAYGTEPLTPANETDISGNAAAYGAGNRGLYGQADADSNLTFDFGFVQPPRSLGNRVWFDVNNNAQINGAETGVPGVRVNLYLDTNADNIPDDLGVIGDRTDDWVAFDTTDANGYYLFDNLPPNIYIVGVDRTNFTAGQPLDEYNSSSGNVDNAANNTDSRDNGVDRVQPGDATLSPFGVISTRINLTATPVNAPTGETGSGNVVATLGFNPTAGDGPNSRGRYGETDANSDLTIDFGFFKPMSIGNRVFLDNGAGGGTTNNGIMDGGEVGIANARVELYRDNNSDGVPDGAFIRFDTTDVNGYYLFDNLTAGNYIVGLPASNFTAGTGALAGLNSSQPTATENVGIAGNPYTPNTDRDDNGVNATNPAATGVFSGTLVLTVDTEPTGETELSGQPDPGATRGNNNPTGWDGPNSRGRWNESDDNSNLTIDFGFIPPLSLGNRVWLDDGAGGTSVQFYNDGIQNGTEVGIANVALSLFFDINDDGDFLDAGENVAIRTTTTNAQGYYLFDGLAPGNYQVLVTAANFGAGQPLNGLASSTGNTADITTDVNDNGIDDANYLANGIRSNTVSLRYGTQPLTPPNETDIPANTAPNTTAYGANLRGRNGEADADSNLTIDFGFNNPPFSLGNRVWLDVDNSGTINGADGGTPGIANVVVNLLDTAGNPVDNPNIVGVQNYTATTDANGYYRFDGLPAGSYVVEIAAANFTGVNPLSGLASSTGVGQEANPNTDGDSNDNGLDTSVTGAIRSGTVTLGPTGTEPINEADLGPGGQGTVPDNRANMTVDFGFYTAYSLGNRVWLDTDNSGTINGGETGIANVVVNLLTTAGVAVDNPNLTGTQNYTATTDANGYYRFDNLPAGDYVVEIAAGNFATAANPLFGFASSTGAGQEATPNTDGDNNDNGLDTPVTGAIRSGTVTLGTGNSEPINEADLGPGGQGTVPDARANMTVDFGFYAAYSLGNRVWLDTDNSGTINGADGATPGIANVVVNLLDNAGNPVDNPNLTGTQNYTATTDATGHYRFDNLLAGDYIVEIAAANFNAGQPLNGLASSTGAGQLADPNAVAPGTDNDDNGLDTPVVGAIRSGTVTLGVGNTEPTGETDLSATGQGLFPDAHANMTVDFGFFGAYSLGNRVWLDADNSGNINGGETGIAGVTVNLLDTLGNPVDNPNLAGTQNYTATTDANGYYRFDNLPAGSYLVEIAAGNFTAGNPLNGLTSSGGAQEATPNSDVDSNDNGLDTPVAGAIRSGTVTLGPGNTEPINEADLGPGGQGTVPDNRANMTVDFGFYTAYSLGNRVWIDVDNSGTINAADGVNPGMDGVTVNLLTAAGAVVDNPNLSGVQNYTVVTDGNGYYRFDNLPAGDYVVEIAAGNFATVANPLFGYSTSTGAGQEANPNTDGDSNDNGLDTAVAGAIRSGTVTLGTGNSEPINEADLATAGTFIGQGAQDNRANMTVDFGFYQAYSLGNRVWLDSDNSGTINGADGAAPGIANVVVNLLDNAGNPVDNPNLTGTQNYTATTDATGYYRFDNLLAGDYIVEIAAANFNVGNPLNGFSSSTGAGQEANPNTDGDSNDNGLDTPVTGAIRSDIVTLGVGNTEPINEADLSATGQGLFPDARANMTVDFGFFGAYSLGNRVWLDTDNSGDINGGEAGIAGVTVNLLTTAGTPVDNPNLAGTQNYTQITDATGHYRFDNLPAGDYVVEIAAANFATNADPLFGFASSTGAAQEANPNTDGDSNDNGLDTPVAGAIRSGTVTLGVGNTEPINEADLGAGGQGTVPDARGNMTVDFGFYTAYSLGNRVWLDTDNSGTINGGETGIANVVVNLLTTAGAAVDNPNLTGTQNYTVTTDGNGYYRFDNLPAGDYVVEIAAGNFATAANPLFGHASSTGAGQEANPNADGDSNDNGIDTPVAGAIRSGTVTLGPGNTEPINEANLGPGAQGNVPDVHANMTVDFGFYQAYSLGNRVWIDSDNSGTINAADGATPGVANVVVNLLDAGGAAVDNPNLTGTQNYTATTDATGYYRFDNLPAGNYIVEIAAANFTGVNPLAGFTSSTGAGQEANPNADGDNNDNGLDTPVAGAIRSDVVTLGTGNSEPINEADLSATGQGPTVDARANMTVDFGFFGSYALGNRVWLDTDNSGNINGGETGIVGVTVRLLDTAGNPVDNPNISGTQDYTLVTDANGYYRFDGLFPGDYVVEIAAGNFTTGNPLFGHSSSTGAGQEANPNTDGDSNDNGIDTPVAGAIRSGTVTLGPGATEPLNEADLGPGGQGLVGDGASNLTVDFGFYQAYSLGNRVWIDENNSGNIDGADGATPGVANVLVNLLTTAGAAVDNPNLTGTQAYTATTDANGYYRFDNLPAGDYVVEIAAGNFTPAGAPLFGYFSSTGAAQEATPNTDGDSNDNGLDVPVAGAIRSGTVTLGVGNVEPLNEADLSATGQGPTVDGRANMTVDFGFYPAYTLGNRVWADLDNSGTINGVDTAAPGIAGVTVNLLTAAGATVDNPNVAGVQPYTVTTDANGYYRFDNLPAGDYIVEIDAANFGVGGVLQNATSSSGAGQEANPNNNVDSNDNGLDTPVAGAIRSDVVTLGTGNVEPAGEGDLAAAGAFAGQGPTIDTRANMTVDFGFVPGFSLGNRVWMDDGIGGGAANDGLINGGEVGIANVQVQLLDGAGNPADNPFVAGVQPYIVTTDANGYYRFDRLPAGNYIVEVIAANFAVGQPLQSVGSSNVTEANPNADVDNTDNGIDALPAVAVRSGLVTLGPGYNEPLTEPDVPVAGAFATQGTVDAWANMTVDFGFVRLFSLGNRVWRDDGIGGGVINDGIQNGAEAGINNVTVRLLDAAGNPADNPNIAGVQDYVVTTSPQGYYRFDNLSAGNYIVEIVAANFVGGGTLANFASSTGAEANPNADVDANDNGLDVVVAGGIRSGQVTLGPLAAEPINEDAPFGQGAPDLQANMTVDFGFVPGSYSLGNRVWIDTDNSGTINGGEAGVNGVTVRLLNNVGTLIATTTTAGGGYYRFDNLAAGNYIVEIAAGNFGAGQPLFGLVSSTGVGQEANPNTDGDNNDNGLDTPFAGAIRSGTVTLGPGDSEPLAEGDLSATGQGALDPRANMTVDFGFITPPIVFSLGNRVWFDADNNGTINAFDGPTPGIANVTVNLLNTGGAIVATTTTDATGHYRFDNLAAGDYIVEIGAGNFNVGQPLANLISSTGPGQEATPNSDVDNNDNGLDVPVAGAIRSGVVTLGPTAIEPVGETDVVAGGAPDNQSNLTVDFGFTNPINTYSIGNHVWRDNGAGANMNNGRMDAGEPGIANVTVTLLDGTGNATVATTTTNANGYYRFDNLPAGNYIVEIAAANFNAGQPLEATTSSTGAFQEANPNTDGDLNDNGLDVLVAGAVRSGVVTLGPGNTEPINETDLAPTGQGAADNRANMTVDFGFVDAFSLGNRVWRDDGTGVGGNANNGIQDGTEPGIAGVTVRLLDATGNTLIATTTTDANGYYRFDSLPPGTYVVEIAAGNFGVGQPLNGLISSPVTNNNPNSDIDLDDNGLDVLVAGAVRSGQVTLGPTATEPINEADLAPSGQGSPDNRANMTVDFGFGTPTNTYSLGNRVWLDDGTGAGGVANDGIQNGTEIGEVGVVVNLIDNTGTLLLATTFTDVNGYYRFDNLAAGNYFVEIAASNFTIGQPLNGLLSSAVTQADPNTDIDRDDNGIDAPPGSAIRSGQVTLGPGNIEPINEGDVSGVAPTSPDNRENLTVDFGFAAPGTTFSLGNRVWLDADNSGTLNGAETGIASVTVRLLNATGTNVIATTTTDANGYYRFDNLAPGDYIVEIASTNFTAGQPLEGLASSSGAGQEALPNNDVDSNDNGLDAIVNGGIRSAVVTLGPTAVEPVGETDVSAVAPVVPDNRENLTVDFGFTASFSLGNRVWFDVNNNSTLDAGEVGIGGVRVELYRDTDGNGAYTAGTDVLINAVNTDGLGYYLFTGLAAADYIVVIPASNFAAAGNPLFGYYSSATSRNNANGNIIETAAPDPDNDTDNDDNGTTSGVLGTANGIVVSLPVTLGPTANEPVGEIDPTSATFPDPTADDRSNTTVDFGFYTMTLGNLVWFDADDNGLVNGTETGLDGVTVYLYPVGGNLAGPPLATTTTANGGLYSFPGLPAGDYIVQIPASNFTGVLTGFSSSTGGAGNPFETAPGVNPNNGTDNDDNGVHTAGPASAINSAPITLTPDGAGLIVDNVTGRTTNNTLDFGLKSSAPLIFSVGNRVFLDYDNNGTQDASEPGIAGVQLRLLDSASNPYDTDPNTAGVQPYLVTTDVSGYYRFDNLPAGDYIIQILEVNFNAGGALVGYNSSTPDEILPNNDVDRNDNGIGTAFIPGTGIVSGVVTLGPAEPTGETDVGTGAQGAADNRANMTVDFGFTPPVGLIISKDDGINAVMTGSTTTYTVNIFNNTGAVANNVQFLDDVPVTDPEGFDPASVSWTCSSIPGGLCPNGNGTSPTINETIATIPVGGRVIYSISGRVRPCTTACGTSITNTARLGTGETATDVDGIIADPFVGVKIGTVVNGTTVHWTMTWSSTAAPGVGQTVVITDTMPAGQSFAGNLTCQTSGTSTQISCSFANGAVVWEGTIFGSAANQITISFDVTVSGAGSYSNSATLTQPGTNVSVVATASVGISTAAGPTQAPPPQCNIMITPDPAFAVPGGKVNWTVNATITDNTKPNIVTITLPAELTLLGVDAPKGAKVTVKGGVISITIDPGVALGPYPPITIRTRIKSNLKAPFTITVLGWMNDHECQASVSILSVDSLPETGQHPPLNVGGILLMAAAMSAGFGLIVVGWKRRKIVV